MSRPNIDETTGRKATDLLDENGKVDTTKIRSIATTENGTDPVTTAETCAEWRREAVGAPNAEAIADGTDFAQDTVRKHLSGHCACVHDVPPLEYNHDYTEGVVGSTGEWQRRGAPASEPDGTDPRVLQPEGETVVIPKSNKQSTDRAYHDPDCPLLSHLDASNRKEVDIAVAKHKGNTPCQECRGEGRRRYHDTVPPETAAEWRQLLADGASAKAIARMPEYDFSSKTIRRHATGEIGHPETDVPPVEYTNSAGWTYVEEYGGD